jgi:glycosyltransferase involved in cell wall biosynthesis
MHISTLTTILNMKNFITHTGIIFYTNNHYRRYAMLAPLLSVIVCTYNRADLLKECLHTLTFQSLKQDDYEVIIVDNNSTDDTQNIVKDFFENYPNFRTVIETKQGLSYARNCGWHSAKGKYVAYIDDDGKATYTWCEDIVNAFENTEPKPVAVGGEIHPWYQDNMPDWFSDELVIMSWGKQKGFLKGKYGRYGFFGSNMAFLKDVLSKYNGFSSEFGMSGEVLRTGEETELFYRIYQKEPLFFYDPGIKVYHLVSLAGLKLTYSFKRGYRAAQATARIENRKAFSLKYIKKLIAFIVFLVEFPILIIIPPNHICSIINKV